MQVRPYQKVLFVWANVCWSCFCFE